jgi:DNA-binding NtrC family response regulator
MQTRNLEGRRILVAEDEYLIADDLSQALQRAGVEVIGPFGSVAAALDAVERDVPMDAAVLDVNLAGERVFPVADRLASRGIPFVFTTGYEDLASASTYRDVPKLEKPIGLRELLSAIARLVS